MTTTKINTLTPDQKEEEREKIAQDIKKYLAKGGKSNRVPTSCVYKSRRVCEKDVRR